MSEFEKYIAQVKQVSVRDAEDCVGEMSAFLETGTLDDQSVLAVLNNRVAYCGVVPRGGRYVMFVAASGGNMVLMGGGASVRREDQLSEIEYGRSAAASILYEVTSTDYRTFSTPKEFRQWRQMTDWTKPCAK